MAVPTSPSRMSRLALFSTKAGPSRLGPSPPLAPDPGDPDDDWYIPYNGPIEQPPKSNHASDSRDSWGDILHGVLSEEEDGARRGASASGHDPRQSHAASAPEHDASRSRAVSIASRQTRSTGAADSRRNTNARSGAAHPRHTLKPKGSTMSFVNLDQLGGVGGTPTPVERTAPHAYPPLPLPDHHHHHRQSPSPASRRASLASIFTFGRRKSLRTSASMDSLARERTQHPDPEPPLPTSAPATATPRPALGRARANTAALLDATRGATTSRIVHEDEYYDSYYSTLLATPGDGGSGGGGPASEDTSLRSHHPYAYPFAHPDPSAPASEPQGAPATTANKGKARLVVPRINFLDPRAGPRGAAGTAGTAGAGAGAEAAAAAGARVPDYLKPSPRNSLLKASISTPNLKGRQRWLAAETCTRSGFSTLARQLSEDLEDLRHAYGGGSQEDDLSFEEPRMWSRLRGPPRTDDLSNEAPGVVLARFTSPTSSTDTRNGYDSPVRLPIDTSFVVAPATDIPEDVESSRASSVFEQSPLHAEENPQERLRVGSIEAVSTPPVIFTPQRQSQIISLIEHSAPGEPEDERGIAAAAAAYFRRDSEPAEPRLLLVPSPRSTLPSPLTPNTRSSYMTSNTDTSRMSGLSDFPAPPTVLPSSSSAAVSATSLLHPHVGAELRPRLEREPSLATFGRQDSAASSEYGLIGEAL
ncbi:uncharacterized protein PHACADRAFT_26288 [Phanerochaete carnosa HHB-10118-sp]|uniref:Uncharacterized protein n=1 Tax=Phanerochaete carnosa (strain HHB-10118-sp) TaxID=650164 RepID=K5WEE7_PHACS|nr:uncharacterized protein PHACADRAFT_26288 [Phanerochaete carnosa HHB-10118-sp]EKM57675.1 hypothetical protein PHACADRAFT_26288 [Phanerochaete carnosa HHB-10118-sp]